MQDKPQNTEHPLSMNTLLLLTDRDIQKWLREVPNADLIVALKGTSSAIQDKVFRNMSSSLSAHLKEDFAYTGPVFKEDVLSKQQRVLEILKNLALNHEVVIPGGNGEKDIFNEELVN